MAERAKASERQGGGRDERRGLAFIDHHRQDYADRVPPAYEGEFLVGDYQDGGELGELTITLRHLGDKGEMFDLQLCLFGDGARALGALLGLAGGDLAPLLRPVRGSEEFSRRLLALGLRDASHRPLKEGR